jgi:hypothetical protein
MRKLVLPVAAIAALALPAVSAAKVVTLQASLNGAKEVPGPGDSDGTGKATIRLNAAKGKVCYAFTYQKIEGVSAGHIHAGGKTVAGNVIVSLFAASSNSGKVSGCVKNIPAKTIRSITSSPKQFYVNLHNDEFAGGAIRGQLHKA